MSERKETPKPWTGQIFLCPKCGNIFNTFDYSCPACKIAQNAKEDAELIAAAGGMNDGTEEEADK